MPDCVKLKGTKTDDKRIFAEYNRESARGQHLGTSKGVGMKIIKKDLAFEGRYLRVVNKHFATPDGKEATWETVERTNIYNRGAVVVVAITEEREVILERNWRAAIESYVIQFPAGLTDVEEETAEEAARRELLEETGYLAKKLIPVTESPLCPVITSTEGTHFFAPDVVFVGKEEKDDAEVIEVLRVPVNKLDELLLSPPNGTKVDLRVPGILWILERKKLI